jgi:hypothetical protein
MSTKSTILLQGNLHIYLELIDMTVHAETENSEATLFVNAGGSQADIELMSLDQWRALGFPEREPDKFMQAASLDGVEPGADETAANLTSQLAEARIEVAHLRAALEVLAEMHNYSGQADAEIHIEAGVYLPVWTFARRALGVEAVNP